MELFHHTFNFSHNDQPWPSDLDIVEEIQQLESVNEATQAVSSVQGICQFEVYHLHRDSPMHTGSKNCRL